MPPPGTFDPTAATTRTPTTTRSWSDYLPDLGNTGRNLADLADAAGVVGLPLGMLGMARGGRVPGWRLVRDADNPNYFTILDPLERNVGEVEAWISHRMGRPDLVVKKMLVDHPAYPKALPGSQIAGMGNQIGAGPMRTIINQLFDYYPEAQKVNYWRATGGAAQGNPFKLYDIPGRLGDLAADAPSVSAAAEAAGAFPARPAPPPVFQEVPRSSGPMTLEEARDLIGELPPGPVPGREMSSLRRSSPPPPGPRREGDWYEFWRPGEDPAGRYPQSREPSPITPRRLTSATHGLTSASSALTWIDSSA